MVIAEHVEERELHQRGPEQLGPLDDCRGRQDSAGATAVGNQALGLGVALGDQPLGGGQEVVDRVLLVAPRARFPPLTAILAAAP